MIDDLSLSELEQIVKTDVGRTCLNAVLALEEDQSLEVGQEKQADLTALFDLAFTLNDGRPVIFVAELGTTFQRHYDGYHVTSDGSQPMEKFSYWIKNSDIAKIYH